jgi:hypothetical protein
MNIDFRKATSDHINFIHNSWLHSAHLTGLAASDLVRIIPKLLPRITMASVDMDGEECLVGWFCALTEPAPCIVYAYVKEPFRRLGVFSSLLCESFGENPGLIQYCCEGGKLTGLLACKHRAIYNPFFLIGRT